MKMIKIKEKKINSNERYIDEDSLMEYNNIRNKNKLNNDINNNILLLSSKDFSDKIFSYSLIFSSLVSFSFSINFSLFSLSSLFFFSNSIFLFSSFSLSYAFVLCSYFFFSSFIISSNNNFIKLNLSFIIFSGLFKNSSNFFFLILPSMSALISNNLFLIFS